MEKSRYAASEDVNHVRPHGLSQFIGQSQVVDILTVHLRAHKNIKSGSSTSAASFGPVIMIGPTGTGKTLAAKMLHTELVVS